MIGLQDVAGVRFLVGDQEIVEWLFVLVRDLVRNVGDLTLIGDSQSSEHQHAMKRGDGTTALGDDMRMWYADFIADGLNVIDDVVAYSCQV